MYGVASVAGLETYSSLWSSKIADDAIRSAAPPQFLVLERPWLFETTSRLEAKSIDDDDSRGTAQNSIRGRDNEQPTAYIVHSRYFLESVSHAIAQSNCRLVLPRVAAGSTTVQLRKGLAGLAPPWRNATTHGSLSCGHGRISAAL